MVVSSPSRPSRHAETDLYEALLTLRTVDELQSFFHDLCTPAERRALAGRWQTVAFLERDVPYREIYERTGVSVTTVGRVARHLRDGSGGYALAASRRKKAKGG